MLRKISTIDFKSSNTTSGKTVLIRVDYNVPVENELVTDDYRILKSIPTIKYCLDQGAKVVLMSHMGRPKGKVNSNYSLIPAGEKLAELLEVPIKFSEDCISEDAIDVSKNINSIHTNHEMKLPNFEEIVPLMLSIFDEPFGDMDKNGKEMAMKLLTSLKKSNKTIITLTDDSLINEVSDKTFKLGESL